MALFQNSVLHKFLQALHREKVNEVWEKFTSYFHNPAIQENIKNAKEEQYQEGFLRELFVKILGYTLNPDPDYNLTTEFKNLKGTKKADGAILKDGKAIAVIELKGTDTPNLDKVERQAFGYKNHQPDALYVITSNFEKLRFYIDNAVDYQEFNLFKLTQEDFELLWLCLAKDSIFKGLPKRIKDDSLLEEENVTKKLYKDYSTFKNEIFENIVRRNPEHDKLVLFKKTQKLLDRFLFIFFAEDRLLLPPNSIRKIIDQWTDLRDKYDEYKPLYERFKKYFEYLRSGRPANGNKDEIFGYNGGLFELDEILGQIKIDDEVLYKHTLNLSHYDFETDVDVNILGHIFEHSINEIEEITAELSDERGHDPLGKTSKRKKEGVFYTPKYITKYIVENTVGQLCEKKKTELGIHPEAYRPNRTKKKKKELLEQLENYRNWLLHLTVCDPACGSGAFLNQALEYLIGEHRQVDEFQTNLLGGSIVFPDVEISILENNLFGVDINEESVEIAKLSLWLRTAKKGRKLTSLSDNIKCGNSLIDDPEVAGEKAFKWEEEFPRIFQPKDLQAFHVVLTTHNSRTSQRMIQYNVTKGDPIWLSPDQEILLSGFIRDVIVESGFRCLGYNICGDHVHLILVCDPDELSDQVQKIKSISSRRFNMATGKTLPGELSKSNPPMGHDPLEYQKESSKRKKGKTQTHLWSQKFFRADLDVWKLAGPATRPGHVYGDTHIGNALAYIQSNRQKHNLPKLPGLQPIIESMTCSEDEAFEIQYKGGFDVVIGNPPYVRQELLKPFKPFFQKTYKTFQGTADLFTYFIELSLDRLLNPNGLYAIIVANKWMRANYGKPLRQWMKQKRIREIIDFGDLPVFRDATAYPCILSLSPKVPALTFWATQPDTLDFDDLGLYVKRNRFRVKMESLAESGWALVNEKVGELLEKLKNKGTPLNEFVKGKIFYGIKTGLNEAFVIDNETKERLIAEDPKSDEIIKPFLAGRDVKRYAIHFQRTYLILIPSGWTNKNRGEMDSWEFLQKTFPVVSDHLSKFEEKAKKRYDKGDYWWELRPCDYYEEFEKPKIVFAEIATRGQYCFDENKYYLDTTGYIIGKSNKALVGLMNSRLWTFLVQMVSAEIRGGFLRWKRQYLENLPVIENLEILKPLVEDQEAEFNELISQTNKMTRIIQRKFNLDKLPQALQNWHTLTFGEFVKELKKKKIKLSLSEEAEWEDYFEREKAKAQSIQLSIDSTDREIDLMVYELYGLRAEEIGIVEGRL